MEAALLELLDVAGQHRDVQTMVAKSLPYILKYVDAERGSAFLMSGEHVVHRVLANRESFSEVGDYKVNTALASGLAGWARDHRQGALASNTRLDDRWVSLDDTTACSAIAVPLISAVQSLAYWRSTTQRPASLRSGIWLLPLRLRG